MGWNLTKVHEQRHVPEDIMRFGKHKNYHSGPAEHNHISLVKEPAHCTQRRAQLLDQQLAARLCDRMVIDAMQARTEQADAGNKATPQESILLDNNTNRATKGTLTLWFENGDITWEHRWADKRHNESGLAWEWLEHIVDALTPTTSVSEGCATISTLTECNRKGTIIRCHPDCRNSGPWHDWVFVDWEDHGLVLGKILFLFENSKGSIQVVLHSAVSANGTAHGVFVNKHQMEWKGGKPVLHCVAANSMHSLALVLPSGEPRTVLHVKDMTDWADCFSS